LCDASYRFLLFDASYPGSKHDSVALANSPLFPFLRQGLPENHWIACDSAYPLVGSLIKPFPGRTRVDIWEDSFNYHLSNLQIVIENAFGIFIQRWGVFWRRFRGTPPYATCILHCCVQLHNFIIDVDGPEKAAQILSTGMEYQHFTFWQGELAEQSFQPNGRGILRSVLVDHIKTLGIIRPNC